jgi:hypothetical protein
MSRTATSVLGEEPSGNGAEYTGVTDSSAQPPTASPIPTVAGMIMLRIRALRNRKTRIRISCSRMVAVSVDGTRSSSFTTSRSSTKMMTDCPKA